MNNRILFIQGGGDEGYEADKKLVASLQTALGETYEVHYPQMLSDETLTDFGWLHQIGKEIANSTGNVILVGHSLGASLLLKYLSENEIKKESGRFFLSLHHFGEATKIGNKVLSYTRISRINSQETSRFFFTSAVMTKKCALKIFCFMRKGYPRRPFEK